MPTKENKELSVRVEKGKLSKNSVQMSPSSEANNRPTGT
jgi:hypothetical protein